MCVWEMQKKKLNELRALAQSKLEGVVFLHYLNPIISIREHNDRIFIVMQKEVKT